MILSSKIPVTSAAPAAAGIPPNIATYHGRAWEILVVKSKFKSYVSYKRELVAIVPLISAFAGPKSNSKLLIFISLD